ncbi:MAG: hypothetical protein N4A41_05080 [Crocinitomicaceae bacterium]|jgi:hypothetical protein|nr:hypothetical protein [Crocinitomicaceae bacterium]
MIKKTALLFLTTCYLLSCQMQQSKSKSTEDTTQTAQIDESKFTKRIAAIDKNISNFQIGNSLAYINNEQSKEEVFAYLDKKNNIIKMEEKFYDAKTKNLGTNFFYLEDGHKFASLERILDFEGHDGQFIERWSFYDNNQQVIFTKERMAEYEDEIQDEAFKVVKPHDCSMVRAGLVLNQQGPFETTFQGFFANGPNDYLIVGGPGAEDFTSTLMVQFVDSQVDYLKKNERQMIGAPLKVEFEKMVDDRNFEFQVLLKAQILSE